MPHPGVPIAPADPAGLDTENDAGRRRMGFRHLPELQRLSELRDQGGSHGGELIDGI